jgi:hypothetical protein
MVCPDGHTGVAEGHTSCPFAHDMRVAYESHITESTSVYYALRTSWASESLPCALFSIDMFVEPFDGNLWVHTEEVVAIVA